MRQLHNLKVIEFQSAPFFAKLGSQNKLTSEQIRLNDMQFFLVEGWLLVKQGKEEYLIHGANVKFGRGENLLETES